MFYIRKRKVLGLILRPKKSKQTREEKQHKKEHPEMKPDPTHKLHY